MPVRPSGKDRLKRKQVGKWRRQNDEKLTEACLISSYFKENTRHLHYKDYLFNFFKETAADYTQNYTKPVNTLRWQHTKLLIFGTGGTSAGFWDHE